MFAEKAVPAIALLLAVNLAEAMAVGMGMKMELAGGPLLSVVGDGGCMTGYP